jgi:hypothetical protein
MCNGSWRQSVIVTRSQKTLGLLPEDVRTWQSQLRGVQVVGETRRDITPSTQLNRHEPARIDAMLYDSRNLSRI